MAAANGMALGAAPRVSAGEKDVRNADGAQRLLSRAFRAWAGLPEAAQQHRREAMFDALGAQLRAAQQRCFRLEHRMAQDPLKQAFRRWQLSAAIYRERRGVLEATARLRCTADRQSDAEVLMMAWRFWSSGTSSSSSSAAVKHEESPPTLAAASAAADAIAAANAAGGIRLGPAHAARWCRGLAFREAASTRSPRPRHRSGPEPCARSASPPSRSGAATSSTWAGRTPSAGAKATAWLHSAGTAATCGVAAGAKQRRLPWERFPAVPRQLPRQEEVLETSSRCAMEAQPSAPHVERMEQRAAQSGWKWSPCSADCGVDMADFLGPAVGGYRMLALEGDTMGSKLSCDAQVLGHALEADSSNEAKAAAGEGCCNSIDQPLQYRGDQQLLLSPGHVAGVPPTPCTASSTSSGSRGLLKIAAADGDAILRRTSYIPPLQLHDMFAAPLPRQRRASVPVSSMPSYTELASPPFLIPDV
eukprot:TRINITY_DN38414_c0_g4_i1.p1 TRINITY_DN38414_c0_g4~~TRINITY_DN38414_c0_g4_i1.p1  ORF type:complete len:475 (-),score=100.70 TRINITY_DN38414_c0_g4_i1:108-1532(-)